MTIAVRITDKELERMLKSKEDYCMIMNRLYREAMLPYFFYIENDIIQIGRR